MKSFNWNGCVAALIVAVCLASLASAQQEGIIIGTDRTGMVAGAEYWHVCISEERSKCGPTAERRK